MVGESESPCSFAILIDTGWNSPIKPQQQNGLPLVRRIAVSNAGEAPAENVELRVSSPDGFVQPASFFVAGVPAGGAAGGPAAAACGKQREQKESGEKNGFFHM